MQREKLAMVGSGILFCLAIVALPNQFLFSKTVPNSFWTEYFPLPFGAGWFIAFIALIPTIWLNLSVAGAMKASIACLLLSVLLAVPLSLAITGDTLSLNNLLNQYLWVGVVCVPPQILHMTVRWCADVFMRTKG